MRKRYLVVDLRTKELKVWLFLSRETQISMKLYSKPLESFWELYWPYTFWVSKIWNLVVKIYLATSFGTNLRKCYLVVDLRTKALEVWFFLLRETQISMKLCLKLPKSFWELFWPFTFMISAFKSIYPWKLSKSL